MDLGAVWRVLVDVGLILGRTQKSIVCTARDNEHQALSYFGWFLRALSAVMMRTIKARMGSKMSRNTNTPSMIAMASSKPGVWAALPYA
jgi:hypothetical protein